MDGLVRSKPTANTSEKRREGGKKRRERGRDAMQKSKMAMVSVCLLAAGLGLMLLGERIVD